MVKSIEYGIRGKSKKTVVQTHGSKTKTVIAGKIQGTASKSIEYGIRKPKTDFELGLTGRGIKGIDH